MAIEILAMLATMASLARPAVRSGAANFGSDFGHRQWIDPGSSHVVGDRQERFSRVEPLEGFGEQPFVGFRRQESCLPRGPGGGVGDADRSSSSIGCRGDVAAGFLEPRTSSRHLAGWSRSAAAGRRSALFAPAARRDDIPGGGWLLAGGGATARPVAEMRQAARLAVVQKAPGGAVLIF